LINQDIVITAASKGRYDMDISGSFLRFHSLLNCFSLLPKYPEKKDRLIGYFGKERIKLIEDNNIQDIWIRDFAPFWKVSNGKIIPVKGWYYPDFGKEDYLKDSIHDDNAGITLGGKYLEHIL